MDEGYIKFKCNWIKSYPAGEEKIEELNKCRTRLYNMKVIGSKNGIGFGNISVRLKGSKFLITGSKTGNIPQLSNKHFTEVTKTDIDNNELTCKGPIIASSESLTHAALYIADKDVNAVIHIHSQDLWSKQINNVPTTKKVPYGTVEMAKEIKNLFENTNVREKKILVMAGHKEGIITFGENLEEAEKVLLSYFS
jgi:L-ribulose-5-phosphate 4-epimerase